MTRENDMRFKFQWQQLVLLEHSHIHSFACYIWLPSNYSSSQAIMAVTTEIVGPTKGKIFTI